MGTPRKRSDSLDRKKIKQIRESKKVTIESLAKKSGVSKRAIINIEKGSAKDHQLNTILSICKALDISITDILI